MENMKKFGNNPMEDMYLTVDQDGVTQNLFATLGKAIDAVAYEKTRRIMPDHTIESTLTMFKWKGNDGKEYSLEVKQCPVCKDVTLDYMARPRSIELKQS